MKTGHNCIQYQCNLGRVWKLQTSSSRITTRLLVACLFVSLATVPFAKAKVRRYKGEIGTPWFDGTGVTQCPIVPGYTFTCVFVVDRPGTYLYHAHCSMQREAGLYGSIRVSLSKGESEPFSYDYDRSIILSGWYHKSTYEQAAGLSSIPFVWVGEPDVN